MPRPLLNQWEQRPCSPHTIGNVLDESPLFRCRFLGRWRPRTLFFSFLKSLPCLFCAHSMSTLSFTQVPLFYNKGLVWKEKLSCFCLFVDGVLLVDLAVAVVLVFALKNGLFLFLLSLFNLNFDGCVRRFSSSTMFPWGSIRESCCCMLPTFESYGNMQQLQEMTQCPPLRTPQLMRWPLRQCGYRARHCYVIVTFGGIRYSFLQILKKTCPTENSIWSWARKELNNAQAHFPERM